jgi:Sulfotransferase family
LFQSYPRSEKYRKKHLLQQYTPREIEAVGITMMNLSNSILIVAARAFEPWTNEVRCFRKEDDSNPQIERGMMFLKTMKTGSTTAMGIQMKIAQNEAQRANSTAEQPCDSVHKHQFAFRGFPNRDRKKSFLWSIVRDPTSRLVSYLFFHYVSRLKNEPYDQGFIDFIRGSDSSAKYDHYMKWMSLTEYKPGESDPVQHANQILADYDFIAITERMVCSDLIVQVARSNHCSNLLPAVF